MRQQKYTFDFFIQIIHTTSTKILFKPNFIKKVTLKPEPEIENERTCISHFPKILTDDFQWFSFSSINRQ